MRKQDIKPGVVYAYKYWGAHPADPVVPIVFLSEHTWIGTLRQDARGFGEYAFKRPGAGTTKPRAGTVYNDGAIGYPAACLMVIEHPPAEQEIAKLKTLKLRDFDRAWQSVGDGYEFLLVTSMARVTGEWGAD